MSLAAVPPPRFDHRGRIEPRFTRTSDSTDDAWAWRDMGWSVPSASGVRISQQTAMQATAVYSCVSMISWDLAKLPVALLFGRRKQGRGKPADSHPLAKLLRQPNAWMTWIEFCQMMTTALLLRGNGFSVILRDGRGRPVGLVPINPDKVALWEAPDGSLFYMVTRTGLHELSVLRNVPLLVPFEDMFHLKGLTSNGLLGVSPITLEREAIGLALAQEQTAGYWAGNAGQVQGYLTTDANVGDDTAKMIAQRWRDLNTGIQRAGKIAILEKGLKFERLGLTGQDMEFLASRRFQIEEIGRIFRVPMHKLGDSTRVTGSSVTQLAQEYLNDTLSTWIECWEQRLDFTFGLSDAGAFVDFDEDDLLRADIATRYAANRVALGGAGWASVDEIRLKEGEDPTPKGGDKVWRPVNVAPIDSDVFAGMADPNDPTLSGPGSDQTGQGGEGGGRPPNDGGDAKPQAIKEGV